jgi:hypothetical protein
VIFEFGAFSLFVFRYFDTEVSSSINLDHS